MEINLLVFYDIQDDKIRTQIANCLKNYGLERIQKSVFLGIITKKLKTDLIKRLRDIPYFDKIHFVEICDACYDKIGTIGSAEMPFDNHVDVL